MESGFGMDGFLWLIQSPSGTGRKTDAEAFETTWFKLFWPVEEVRGGMAFGERRLELSDTIADGPAWEILRWYIRGSNVVPRFRGGAEAIRLECWLVV